MAASTALSARGSAAGIVFLQLGARLAGGSTKPPTPSLPRLAPKPAPLYLFWLSGALLSIYFFSLCFIFIFKLLAGLDAVHSPRCLGARRADCRSRLAGPGGSPASCTRGQGAGPPGTRAARGAARSWGGDGARPKDSGGDPGVGLTGLGHGSPPSD